MIKINIINSNFLKKINIQKIIKYIPCSTVAIGGFILANIYAQTLIEEPVCARLESKDLKNGWIIERTLKYQERTTVDFNALLQNEILLPRFIYTDPDFVIFKHNLDKYLIDNELFVEKYESERDGIKFHHYIILTFNTSLNKMEEICRISRYDYTNSKSIKIEYYTDNSEISCSYEYTSDTNIIERTFKRNQIDILNNYTITINDTSLHSEITINSLFFDESNITVLNGKMSSGLFYNKNGIPYKIEITEEEYYQINSILKKFNLDADLSIEDVRIELYNYLKNNEKFANITNKDNIVLSDFISQNQLNLYKK